MCQDLQAVSCDKSTWTGYSVIEHFALKKVRKGTILKKFFSDIALNYNLLFFLCVPKEKKITRL